MKVRIIAGLACAALFVTLLFYMDTIALPIFVALLSGLSVYELSTVAKVTLPMKLLSMAVGIFIPFDVSYNLLDRIGITPMVALSAYFITLLIMMIKWNSKVKFDQVSMCLMASIAVPNALACLIRLYEWKFITDAAHVESHAIYLIFTCAVCSWGTDTYSYFSGVLFGKHKMSPVISPKKTWEGAIGGVFLATLMNVGVYFVAEKFFSAPFTGWEWYTVIPISIAVCVIGIFGDLCASVIKRNYGIKDYGNLIPGHGGAMDRIDSAIFVLPAMYVVVNIVDILKGIN